MNIWKQGAIGHANHLWWLFKILCDLEISKTIATKRQYLHYLASWDEFLSYENRVIGKRKRE